MVESRLQAVIKLDIVALEEGCLGYIMTRWWVVRHVGSCGCNVVGVEVVGGDRIGYYGRGRKLS